MVSHVQVPAQQVKSTFRGEKEVGRAIVNKEFTAFHWLSPCEERRQDDESFCWDLLQCSCLENPRDRGAWWAAVSGVAQSRTRLKRLSSSSSSSVCVCVSVCVCLCVCVYVYVHSSHSLSHFPFPFPAPPFQFSISASPLLPCK